MIIIELDNDTSVTFTMFANEYSGKPIKTPTIKFSQFISTLSKPHIGTKNSRGAFVGGEVDEWRKNDNVRNRSMLTVDIDDIPSDVDIYSHISSHFGYLFMIYSTFNHKPESQRFRLVIPLDKPYDLSPEAYREVIKHLCVKILDIPYYDPASEVMCQLMYFPTTQTLEHYEMHYQDEEVFRLSDILGVIEIPTVQTIQPKTNEYWLGILKGLHEGEGKGRDSTAASLMGHLLRRYIDPLVAYELVACWNERNSPPLPEKDLKRIYESIFKSEMSRRTK